MYWHHWWFGLPWWIIPYPITWFSWSGLEAFTPAPWPSLALHLPFKFLDLYDEIAGQGCYCFLLRWDSWAFWAHRKRVLEIYRAQIWIFQFYTFDVYQIFRRWVTQSRPKKCYIAISWRDWAGFLFLEYSITYCVSCLGSFLFFLLFAICTSIFGTMLSSWHK